MAKTITALFGSEQHAAAAADHLLQAGIPRDEIDIWSTPHNLAPLLEDDGVSRLDAHAYAEGVRRGCSLVIVKSAGRIGQIVHILDQDGSLDLDELQASWRSEGWQEAAELVGLPESPNAPSASAETATSGSPDEASHSRVRIQPGKFEPPVQT